MSVRGISMTPILVGRPMGDPWRDGKDLKTSGKRLQQEHRFTGEGNPVGSQQTGQFAQRDIGEDQLIRSEITRKSASVSTQSRRVVGQPDRRMSIENVTPEDSKVACFRPRSRTTE